MNLLDITNTKPIIEQLRDRLEDVPGWSPLDQLHTLFSLAYSSSHLDGDIVEIGSWCGRSALALGLAAKLSGNTRLHCVDLFPTKDDWHQNHDGSYSFKVTIDKNTFGGYQEQTVWEEPFNRDIKPLYSNGQNILDIFNNTITTNALQDITEIHIGTSETFSSSLTPGFKCRLAFLDGDHSYEKVCRDIENIEKFLVPNGWICFDDAFSYYDGVNRAIHDRIISSKKYDLYQQMTRKLFIARRRFK